jgi:hypothetical protein
LLNDQKEKAKTIAGLREEIRQLKEQAKAASS